MRFILVFFLVFSSNIFCQSKQENILEDALMQYSSNQREDAINQLSDAVLRYPSFERGFFVLSSWLMAENKYDLALKNLEKLEAINPNFNVLQKRMMAECHFVERKLDKALRYAQDFENSGSLSPTNTVYIQNLIRNINFVKTNPEDTYKIIYKRLGPEINSNESEYLPSTDASESHIYFTRKSRGGEDIWVSYKSEGVWTPAVMVDEPELENDIEFVSINSYENDGAHTIAPSGRFLFFTSCNRPKSYGSCDLYLSSIKGNEWGKPKIISPPVNSKSWESQPCISADGKQLFFLSSREGSLGGQDIYVSNINTDGTFSEPKNLGTKINTEGREEKPFIHPDGQTLYFSSDGLPGYGGLDLFMSRRENGEWQTPINLGSQINSHGDETSIFINALGTVAYVSRQNIEQSRRDIDLYTFPMPEKYKPQPVTYIKGRILNAKTNEPIKASVKLSEIEKNLAVMSISSDEKTGEFLMTLPANKEYGFNVLKEGFALFSQNYTFENSESSEPKQVDIKLLPLEAGTKFELRNVFFETGKFELKSTSYLELNFIVEILKKNPNLRILVAGHTDNVGQETSNQLLSENRASAVMNYLIEKGITKERLESKGYGSSKPLMPNDSEEGKAKNRRTEIEIL